MSEESPRGRPSVFTPEIATEICRLMAEGRSLREICRADDMPPESTVRGWAVENRNGFSAQYATAREAMLDRWAEEIVEIADDATNDWMDRKSGEHTIAVADTEHINRSRLRIDTRKWLMSKLAPKRYGERVEQVMSGSIAVSRVERVIVDHASDRNGPGLSPLTPALKI